MNEIDINAAKYSATTTILGSDGYEEFLKYLSDVSSEMESTLFDPESSIDEIEYNYKQLMVNLRGFAVDVRGEFVSRFGDGNTIYDYLSEDIGIYEKEIRTIDPDSNVRQYTERDVLIKCMDYTTKFSNMGDYLAHPEDQVVVRSNDVDFEFVPTSIL